MNNVAKTYTQLSIQGASPVGLVVALYDNALTSLYRAKRAMAAKDIARRTQHLNHVLSIIAHLQGTLDLERGGEVAKTLLQFYTYARARILEISVSNSTEMLMELTSHFSALRSAWQIVETRVPDDLGFTTGRA